MKTFKTLVFIIFVLFYVLSANATEKRYDIPTENSPVIGDENAPVTVVEFIDYQWPHCVEVGPTIESLVKEFEGKIKLVIKFFPYQYRDYARIAAEAAVEAWKQGKFAEMHELLLKRSPKLDRDSLIEYAKELNLDIEKFKRAIDNQEGSSIIERDLKLTKELDLYGTPAFYINGIKVLGVRDAEYFKEIILKELKNVEKK